MKNVIYLHCNVLLFLVVQVLFFSYIDNSLLSKCWAIFFRYCMRPVHKPIAIIYMYITKTLSDHVMGKFTKLCSKYVVIVIVEILGNLSYIYI